MRRRDYYWSLFQKSEKRQLDDLRTEYVEVAFEVLSKAHHDDWLVWREGFRSWKPLADFPALVTSLREGNVGFVAQPAPPLGAAAGSGAGEGVAAGAAQSSNAAANAKVVKGGAAAASGVGSSSSDTSGTDPNATLVAEKKTSVMTRLQRASGGNVEADFAISDESATDDRDVRYPKKWEVRIVAGGKAVVNYTVDVSVKGMALRDPLPRGLPNYFNVEIKTLDAILPVICSEVKTPDGAASKRLRIEVNQNPGALQQALLAHG